MIRVTRVDTTDVGSRYYMREPGTQDITLIWQQSHTHLRLLPEKDGIFKHVLLEHCLLCGEQRAVRLRVRLRFGEHWEEHSTVLFCYACQRYSYHAGDHESYSRVGKDEIPNAVDARLWSRTPTVLNLEPTTRCNFNCWYCVGRSLPQQDLALHHFSKVLKHLPPLQVLLLVGEGEPFMHPQFFEMIKQAHARGIRVATSTNGSLLTDDVIQNLCETGVMYLSISIDSIVPETFAESRRNGDLEQVLGGAERLVRYRDRHGYAYPALGLKGTLFPHTEEELPAIIARARQCGFDYLENFQPLNPMASYLPVYPQDKRPFLNSVKEIAQAISLMSHQQGLPEDFRLPNVTGFIAQEGLYLNNEGHSNHLRPNCDQEWLYCTLSGDITPCCYCHHKLFPDNRWNLFERPLHEILHEETYENMRFNLWNGIMLKICEGCPKLGW